MSNEKFFRMLSIALLGAVALACVPDSQAVSPQASVTEAVSFDSGIPVEIEIVREVDEINAGRFNPAIAGSGNPAAQGDVLSGFPTTALLQFDPNL